MAFQGKVKERSHFGEKARSQALGFLLQSKGAIADAKISQQTKAFKGQSLVKDTTREGGDYLTMVTTLDKQITLEEFLQLPETKPASEFINGRIYQKPMPQGKHSRLQLKLCNAVNQVAEEPQIALAFPELRCTFGGRSIVPDVTAFRWERIPFDTEGEIENVFALHPDWTIEFLSPDQNATKVISNILHCLKHGTQLGWFIDPDERLIIIFLPGQQPIEMTGDDRLPVPEFLELELTVAQVFGWLKAGKPKGDR